jgi:hypothetical protein
MKSCLFIAGMIVLAGCSEPLPEFQHFLDREAQAVSERESSPLENPLDVLNLSDFDIYSPGTLEQNSTHLFLINYGMHSITKVAKNNFDEPEVISFSEGSGPGELQSLQSLAVGEERLYTGDPRQQRIVVTDTDGTHIKDLSVRFSPDNLVYIDDDLILNYNAHQQDYLFTVYHAGSDTTSGFEEIDFGFNEIMKYPGHISVKDSFIYFAGYSEPLLRKYSFDGTLQFSRANIDNFDTSDHYVERTMGDNRVVGFSDEALYSSLDVSIYKDHLIVIPYHNGINENRYLDLYSTDDGDYIKTLSPEFHPRKIAVDENHLYMLAREGDDNILLKYRYPLQ